MLGLLFIFALGLEAAGPQEFFESRVRPVLAKNCFSCHTQTRMGGLEMNSREAFLKGGNSGPAVAPGDPEHSLLMQAVRQTHARLKMPPAGKLKDDEIADLALWIKAGAVWPEQSAFWAFQPLRKSAPPAVKARSAIDRFILAQLEARGLKPVKPASKTALIRRATFDLIGLPPTPEEVDAFVRDNSPEAFAKVVDRRLASPRYGERWGRYWLDVARYSDDKLDSTGETPHPNAFRYRDWVIEAFNRDMPYDRFVKAQIAGDLIGEPAGTGMYALSPEQQDDRVDVTTRGFLGLTVACAQYHDHKYDPIPTKDYYSLLGVFNSSVYYELPLAAKDEVERYDAHKKKIEEQETRIKEFVKKQAEQLAEILGAQIARYLLEEGDLDKETLDRWKAYLKQPQKEHPYLKAWEQAVSRGASKDELRRIAEEFQALALKVNREKHDIDTQNLIRLGGSDARRDLANANLLSLERDKYFLWRDLFSDERRALLYYGDKKIDRFLSGQWKAHLEGLRAELEELKRALPKQYAFLHTIRDIAKPVTQRVYIRGVRDNPGEEAPRRFLSVLCNGAPVPFTHGSGRLELAEAIASPTNPLTARVMVNRIWQHHFGQGLVRTPSNFGQLGDRPSHPELLDYLAARFVENGWSVKAMHREIMLSATYALSTQYSDKNYTADPDNRLLWRAKRQRLDIEALRDSMLFVAGTLDAKAGGPPTRLTEEKNVSRTVYGYVSRKKLDSTLAMFDFPNPNTTSEQRIVTNVPLQRLFFLNSAFVMKQAEALARRLTGTDRDKVRQVYRMLFSREPSKEEGRLGLEYLISGAWPEYAQVLLSSNEFLFVN